MSIAQEKALTAIIRDGMAYLIPDIHPKFFTVRTLKNIFQSVVESITIKKSTSYESVMDCIANGNFNETEKGYAIASLKAIIAKNHIIGPNIPDVLMSEYRKDQFKQLVTIVSDDTNTENQRLDAIEKAYKELNDFSSKSDNDQTLLELFEEYRRDLDKPKEDLESSFLRLYNPTIAALFPLGKIYPFPYYITAPPNFGKTLLLINVMNDLITSGYNGIFYSMENKRDVIRNKFLALKTGFEYDRIVDNALTPEEKNLVREKFNTVEKNLIIKDQWLTVDEFLRDISKQCLTRKVDFIAVDHCNIFNGLAKDPSKDVSTYNRLTSGLIQFKKEFNIPTICLTQSSERKMGDKEKTTITLGPGDIKGSGSFWSDGRFNALIDGEIYGNVKNLKWVKVEVGPKMIKQIELNGAISKIAQVYNV